MQKSDWEQKMDMALIDVAAINSALESNLKMIQLKAMFKIVQSGLFNDKTIAVLQSMSKRFEKDKDQVMGVYMLGHFSLATLFEICNKKNSDSFKSVFDVLDEDTQRQVNILIKSKSLYQS
ncbi:hypothetical protein [Paenibacillus sp. FSL R5-0912]|uniref:hypothetical protein n=1 Tax=Paenibacillus sp. FSL R5-0912 TaxID=1536771 RepID=UPI0004F74761|nr:hypothetical protein [Paenibacillus sp. FSL R5-0912]AIQ39675.1 hypothetical protein R50912_06235 [Paenibacillus sp. FSL R5-0912]